MEAYDFFIFVGSLALCSDLAFTTVYPCALVEQKQAGIAMRDRDNAAIDRHFARPNADAMLHSSDDTRATTSNAFAFGAASISSPIAQSDAVVAPVSADKGGEPSAKRACNVSAQRFCFVFRTVNSKCVCFHHMLFVLLDLIIQIQYLKSAEQRTLRTKLIMTTR